MFENIYGNEVINGKLDNDWKIAGIYWCINETIRTRIYMTKYYYFICKKAIN